MPMGGEKENRSYRGGSFVRTNKTIIVRFRVTEEELTKLETLMALEGFRNRSSYLRKCVLGGRIYARRNLKRTDANITKQIQLLRTEIKKIAVNYNQVVKSMNTFARLRDKQGHSVISEVTVNGHLTDLKAMMVSLLSKVNTIEAQVTSEETDSSHDEDSDNYQ